MKSENPIVEAPTEETEVEYLDDDIDFADGKDLITLFYDLYHNKGKEHTYLLIVSSTRDIISALPAFSKEVHTFLLEGLKVV